MSDSKQIVFIIDDDDAVRDSLSMLIRSAGFKSRVYPSAIAFLQSYQPEWTGCMLLDIRMSGMNGFELQQELIKRNISIPVVFIAGEEDASILNKVDQTATVDILEKPFNDDLLIDRIQTALLLNIPDDSLSKDSVE